MNMLSLLLLLFLLMAPGALLGGIAGWLAARWYLLQQQPEEAPLPVSFIDPQVDAEIDQAAAQWAAANDRPEAAAGLVAEKLRLAHTLHRRSRRFDQDEPGWRP